MTEGQALKVLHTLNTVELDQAQLALRESDNREVRDVAQYIRRDHTQSNERIEDFIEDERDLEKSTLNNGLKMQLEANREEMTQLSGAAFDCFYLTTQIEQHEMALDIVRGQLQPAAETPEVQSMLKNAEPWLASHLESAEDARQSLDDCDGS